MNKYLATGTATWTAATRTITIDALSTLSNDFVAGDATYQRQIFFRIGTSLYFGRIASVASVTSVVMLAVGTLPAIDGTITELFLLDLNEAHSYQAYMDELAMLIKDDIHKLSTADLQLILAKGLTVYSKDRPLIIRKKIAGTGATDYNLAAMLGSLWTDGYSQISAIEFPAGQNPAVMLEDDDWTIYDDGTAQDGSNDALRFLNGLTPESSEHFIVELYVQLSLPPAGTQNFPDTQENFLNITLVAGMFACFILAAAYAASTDSSIGADVVNYHDKSRKYTDLGKTYERQYNQSVYGQEDPPSTVEPAWADKVEDLRTTPGIPFIFHDRKMKRW